MQTHCNRFLLIFSCISRFACKWVIALGAILLGASFGSAQISQQDDNPKWRVERCWDEKAVQQAGENFWPQFRGPRGDGHAASTATPPTHWSEKENVRWKHSIAGKAWSSPVVWGSRIWLTNATTDGHQMSVHCLDLSTGESVWERVLLENQEVQKDYHEFNSYASPTPVVDDSHVFVSFGAYGTFCLERDTGKTVWARTDLPCNHYRGAGSSPILFRNAILFHMDGFDFQYVIALDRVDGSTLWRTDRAIDYGTDNGDYKKAYGTPHIIEVMRNGEKELQLISPAAKAILSYDPIHGTELWKVRYDEHSAALRPLFDGDQIYTSTGFSKGKLLAIRPTERGDVTDSAVVWQASKSIGAKPSPLLVGDSVVSLEDRGVLSAFRKADGEILWQKRLGGDFSSSPILAAGLIYCVDEQGKTHVVRPDGEVVAVNSLPSGCLASPVAVGKLLLLRTREALYAFQQ